MEPSSQGREHLSHPWDYRTIAVLTTVHACALLAPFCFTWSGFFVALGLYVITAMGITLGYHRLLTHRSFEASTPLAYFLVSCAALSVQAGPATWVAIHRQHHAHSDQGDEDPHDATRGFWWSHMGWMLELTPRRIEKTFTQRFARDILDVPFYRFLDRFMFPLALLSLYLLYQIGGLSWLVWAGPLRIAFVFHTTWFVNSAAHCYGYQSFRTGDRSTNCWWVALLSFGEGWHNNHHAFPRSARHGLTNRELDLSWVALKQFEKLGWVWKVRTPNPQQMEQRRLRPDSCGHPDQQQA